MAIGTLLALTPSIFQYIKSRQQKREAKNLQKSTFIPPSVQEATNVARSNANATVTPGYSRSVERLEKISANSISNAKKISTSSGNIMAAVSKADALEKEGIKDLGARNDWFRFQNRGVLSRILQQKGIYEQRNQDKYDAAKSALRGASDQNLYNSVTNVAKVGVNFAGENPDFFGNIFKNKIPTYS